MAKRTPPPIQPHPPHQFQNVDPRWLLKAGGITLFVALIFSYITLCVLFYQGQWQLVLHPSRTVARTPATVGLTFEPVRFGVDATGTPQLSGWWIPSDTDEHTARTAIVMHGADGSMADALPQATILHDAHLNVLLFDYRGYGTSEGSHPNQLLMEQDAHSALDYVRQAKQVGPNRWVVFGEGLGASLAVQACSTIGFECPAIILNAPDGDLLERAKNDSRARLVPVSMLFSNTFPLADALHTSKSPKLIISYGAAATPQFAHAAADPKVTVELPSRSDVALDENIKRFLDEFPEPE